jgi:hypothetical protein
MYSELSTVKRSAGGQKKHFTDSLKVSLKRFKIDTPFAMDRYYDCRTSSVKATVTREQKHAENLEMTTNFFKLTNVNV